MFETYAKTYKMCFFVPLQAKITVYCPVAAFKTQYIVKTHLIFLLNMHKNIKSVTFL